MITTLRPLSKTPYAPKTRLRIFLALALLLVTAACSNSKLVLSPLYNRLDDMMRKEFDKLGEFDDTQTRAFEQRLQTFHLWHRRNELPLYADLLDDLEVAISTPKRKTTQQVAEWSERIEARSKTVRLCHPVNFSYDLMKTVTDEQIDYIEKRFAREQTRNRTEYLERTPEERIERRYNNIVKWSGRVGLKFTQEQKTLLKATLQKQIPMRERYWELSGDWNKQFFALTRAQNSFTYDKQMTAHLEKLWNLLETNETENWLANRALWSQFALEFVNSMTTAQREWADAWLPKLADTLRDISNDSVKFESSPDFANRAEFGCT